MTPQLLHPRRGWDWSAMRALCLREADRVLGPGASAEDAAQEAMLRAWRYRSRIHPEAASGWLATLARREALRIVAGRRDVPVDSIERSAPQRAPTDDLVAVRVVRDAVARLEPDERRLLWFRYWADQTQPEVARCLGLPEGTVKVRLHRVRRQLRSKLGD